MSTDATIFRLPLLPDGVDIDAELARLDAEADRVQSAPVASLATPVDHWADHMVSPTFSVAERARTTLLVSGLTAAHDHLVKGALAGLGYNVEVIDVPDNEALRYGKEFGNRGQCNPTYFTVGNLVKFLSERARRDGLTARQIVDKYVFLTAGACGPCRFGMYATEYRKALRDAGFDGFRVLLFQQKGGLKQATGEEAGLDMSPRFFLGLLRALVAGDVINGMGYRLRPFEVERGATDRAIANARTYVHDALAGGGSVLRALLKARREFARIQLDWTRPCPRVSIIGEFWAMTTEGDGNYQLQRFLESEGAECDIQFVTNWLLYMLWEGRYDTKLRAELRGQDAGPKGARASNVGMQLATLFLGDVAVRATFQLFGACIGFRGYHLPDMDVIARTAHDFYDNNLRGGEGHMEVGKFILNVLHNKSHMTLSVKPFGCMPSSGVSDGVQSLITGKYPQSIFCAIETSGDGKVNVQSRVQMSLFKARQAAQREYETALQAAGVSADDVRAFLERNPRYASALHRAPHAAGGTAADRLAEIAPLLGKSHGEIRALLARRAMASVAAKIAGLPAAAARLRAGMVARGPVLLAQAREEWAVARPQLAARAKAALRDKVATLWARVAA